MPGTFNFKTLNLFFIPVDQCENFESRLELCLKIRLCLSHRAIR